MRSSILNTFLRQGQLKLCWENEIDGCNWHNENHDEWTPLMIASYNNHEDAVKILLQKTGGRPKAKWDGMFKIIYFFLYFLYKIFYINITYLHFNFFLFFLFFLFFFFFFF